MTGFTVEPEISRNLQNTSVVNGHKGEKKDTHTNSLPHQGFIQASMSKIQGLFKDF